MTDEMRKTILEALRLACERIELANYEGEEAPHLAFIGAALDWMEGGEKPVYLLACEVVAADPSLIPDEWDMSLEDWAAMTGKDTSFVGSATCPGTQDLWEAACNAAYLAA